MTIKNLWGEINNLPKVKAPVAVLNEQAQFLSDLTGGLLTGEISQVERSGDRFIYSFYIHASSLNNYYYFVLRIDHDIHLYPLNLTTDKDDSPWASSSGTICNDVNEFEIELGKIFSSSVVQRVISGLLSQIQTA
ncbi:hypothetical protein [Crenothrix sp.]|uniref:hypothetical protein n=1 Tax=Crenothrix sp. TaxID=3100433 RepID=UPI00374D9D49